MCSRVRPPDLAGAIATELVLKIAAYEIVRGLDKHDSCVCYGSHDSMSRDAAPR